MRKYLLAFACMMAVVQHVRAQDYFSSASDFARLYVGAMEPQYPKSLWFDMPYYKGNADLYKGRISYHGVVYEDVQLRFDQLKQCVIVLPPGERVLCLPEQDFVDWFEMDGRRFVRDPEDSLRYASLLCDGSFNGIRLYHCEWKSLAPDRLSGGRKYLKTLYSEEHYTLVTPDGEMYHVKRASDVAKLFPGQKKQIRQFAKQNRLSFSRREREKSLVALTQSIAGAPIFNQGYGDVVVREREFTPATDLSRAAVVLQPHTIDESTLVAGIPVLDNDSVASSVGSKNTKVYIVPGVKKAKASIADDQELAEIVVVGGRQSAVKNMMMGSEKFKPQILKLEKLPAGIMCEEEPQTRTSYSSMEVRCITRRICSDCSRRSIQMPLRMLSCSNRAFLWNMVVESAVC